ncbi:MAG: sigma-70 family RNA polymerase sigma factor [Nitriliruptoraceae bacterium]
MHAETSMQQMVTQRVLSHRWLSVEIAKRFVFTLPRWVDCDDVQQAADLGLVEAASRFDAGYGVPFVPYARVRITGAVRDELRARDPLSRSARQRLTQLERARDTLTGLLGRTVTTADVIASLASDHAEQARFERWQQQCLPESIFVDVTDGVELEAVVVSRERVRFVTVAVLSLPAHLAAVVPCISDAVPLRTLADRYGVSVATVSRQRTVALAWLHAAVAFYDGVPVAESQPFGSDLRGYLRRVTVQAASTACS